jgi:hypothetical protein
MPALMACFLTLYAWIEGLAMMVVEKIEFAFEIHETLLRQSPLNL